MADIITSPVTISGAAVLNGASSNFTPGAAFSIKVATDIINAAWTLGGDMKADFASKVATLSADIAAILAGQANHIAASSATSTPISEPVVNIPASVDTSTILATFDSETTSLIALFAGKVSSFLTTYFPNDSADYAAAESWLMAALANPSGLPAAVAAQIYADERDRNVAEATRAKDSLFASFAARRFPIPPGALVSANLQIDQKTQDITSEAGRKIIIMSVEQLRWAVEKTTSLRQVAHAAALDYARTMAQGPTIAASVTGIGYDAQTKLIGAASSFYGARAEAAKVLNSINQFNATAAQDAAAKNQAADLKLIEDRVRALMAEIQAIAQMATSLFNNVHASAGTSYSVSGT